MIIPHPRAARVEKPVGMFGSGLFAIKPPSHWSSKQNGPLIDDGRSKQDSPPMTNLEQRNRTFFFAHRRRLIAPIGHHVALQRRRADARMISGSVIRWAAQPRDQAIERVDPNANLRAANTRRSHRRLRNLRPPLRSRKRCEGRRRFADVSLPNAITYRFARSRFLRITYPPGPPENVLPPQ